MGLENASYIPELVPANPPGSDFVLEGDNHLRMVKQVLQNQFPGVPAAAVINAQESPNSPDDGLTAPANVMFWSPKAIADFIQTHWADWGLTAQTGAACFSVHKNEVGQNIDQDQTTLVTWSTAEFDDGGRFDFTTHRHVPGAAALGRWRYRAQLYYDAGGSGSGFCFCMIRHHAGNGTLIREIYQQDFVAQDGAQGSPSPEGIFNITAPDEYVDVYTRINFFDAIEGTPSATLFEGEYIGAAPAL